MSNCKVLVHYHNHKNEPKKQMNNPAAPRPDNKFLGNNLWASSIVSKHGCKKSNFSWICIFYSRMIYAHSSTIIFNFNFLMIAQSFRITSFPKNYCYGYFVGGSMVIVFKLFPYEKYEGSISKLLSPNFKTFESGQKRKA